MCEFNTKMCVKGNICPITSLRLSKTIEKDDSKSKVLPFGSQNLIWSSDKKTAPLT